MVKQGNGEGGGAPVETPRLRSGGELRRARRAISPSWSIIGPRLGRGPFFPRARSSARRALFSVRRLRSAAQPFLPGAPPPCNVDRSIMRHDSRMLWVPGERGDGLVKGVGINLRFPQPPLLHYRRVQNLSRVSVCDSDFLRKRAPRALDRFNLSFLIGLP